MPSKLPMKEISKLSMKNQTQVKFPRNGRYSRHQIPNERNMKSSGEIWQNREISHRVPTWEIWKVPMKYKTAEKSFEQYDMLLVSIGHFSSNIGHILVVGRQSRKRNLAHNQHICCKENDTCKGWSFKQSRKDREINGLIYFECGWGGWLHCWKEKIIQRWVRIRP